MPIEPGLLWEIDLFRPEDAQGVVELFLTVYGEGYPIRHFIDAELLKAENAAQRVVSTVVRTSQGDIVGHNAMFHSAPYEGIWESGSGLVHPLYRGGKHIFTDMVKHGQDLLLGELAGQGIFGEPVLNHVFSQRLTNGMGWISLAAEVDLMPAEAYAKEQSAQGRVSNLLDFGTLRSHPHEVFLPTEYEAQLRLLYGKLNDQRTLSISRETPPTGSSTSISSQVFPFAQVARIPVPQTGQDFPAALNKIESEALAQGVKVFQVWLNLAETWAGWACGVLRERGYFFGGVLPRWFNSDALLMQRMTHRPHWEEMNIHYDWGKEIVALARADWERSIG